MADMEDLFGSDADSEPEQKGAGRGAARSPRPPGGSRPAGERERAGEGLPHRLPAAAAAARLRRRALPRASFAAPLPWPKSKANGVGAAAPRFGTPTGGGVRFRALKQKGLGGQPGLRGKAVRSGCLPSPQPWKTREGKQKQSVLLNLVTPSRELA